jgi:single-strand DNA-binding protein
MINKVILVGNVGRDPEIRSTSSGTPVANFRLATNERRKDANGEWVDHTEWHTVVVWGRMVSVVEQYVHKGRQLYIEGALRTREWEQKDGQKRYSTEIHARELKLLGSRSSSDGGGSSRDDYGSVGQGFPDDADDVPF